MAMENTVDMPGLTLEESDRMHNDEQNDFQEPEQQFEINAIETDESLDLRESFDSDESLGSDGTPERDEDVETDEKVIPVASLTVNEEQDQENDSLQAENDALHAQEQQAQEQNAQKQELEQVEEENTAVGNSDEIKTTPKKSKWLAQWFQWQEDLY